MEVRDHAQKLVEVLVQQQVRVNADAAAAAVQSLTTSLPPPPSPSPPPTVEEVKQESVRSKGSDSTEEFLAALGAVSREVKEVREKEEEGTSQGGLPLASFHLLIEDVKLNIRALDLHLLRREGEGTGNGPPAPSSLPPSLPHSPSPSTCSPVAPLFLLAHPRGAGPAAEAISSSSSSSSPSAISSAASLSSQSRTSLEVSPARPHENPAEPIHRRLHAGYREDEEGDGEDALAGIAIGPVEIDWDVLHESDAKEAQIYREPQEAVGGAVGDAEGDDDVEDMEQVVQDWEREEEMEVRVRLMDKKRRHRMRFQQSLLMNTRGEAPGNS